MTYEYSYALKDIKNRQNVDLREHEVTILNAINEVFSNKVITINVYKTYFEFFLESQADDSDLRVMGKKIAQSDNYLNDLKKDYGYSTQLFKRNNRISTKELDIVVFDKNNNINIITEVKGFDKLSEAKALAIKNDILTEKLIDSTKYILVVSQENGYLWDVEECSDYKARPLLAFSTKEIVNRYLSDLQSERKLKHDELEMIFKQWFYTININNEKPEDLLNDIGLPKKFIDIIRDGYIMSEVTI